MQTFISNYISNIACKIISYNLNNRRKQQYYNNKQHQIQYNSKIFANYVCKWGLKRQYAYH